MKFSRKQLLALGFGLWTLSFGLWVPKTWAAQGSDNFDNFFRAKKIIVSAHLMPWDNTAETLDETKSLLNSHSYVTIQSVQQLAFDYIQDNLDPKLKNCIEILSPRQDRVSDYAITYDNLFLTIEFDANAAEINGKLEPLVSLYLRASRPTPAQAGKDFTNQGGMPTQAIFLGNDPARFQNNLKTTIERLLTHSIRLINHENSCKEP